jgi:hypothetical protein
MPSDLKVVPTLQTTRHPIPEDGNFSIHRPENLRFFASFISLSDNFLFILYICMPIKA